MDRRDFIKSVGVAGGLATGIASMTGALSKTALAAAASAGAAGGIGGQPPSRAREALLDLLETIREAENRHLGPASGITDPDVIAEGERALAHILETALFFWLEANPERPVFKRYVTPTRKLLGDNPDALYYFAPIRDDRSYRIRGNIGAATFTSFTIEGGSGEGHAAVRSISALGDGEMEIAPDGRVEILVSRQRPARGNWLRLEEGAGQITTRHYYESRQSVAPNDLPLVSLSIEPLDPAPLAPHGGDAEVGRHLEWVAHFVREHAAMVMTPPSPEMAKQLGWVSLEPNRFTDPGRWVSASEDIAYGNTHAYYASAPYRLARDEALVIDGRFPDCRFANVVLWNRFMQSYDFANRRISLNRQQIDYQEDGSFRIVVAHANPGVPNWLDTEGRPTGQIYWRFVFPVEAPRRVKTKVVKVASLAG
jgi:hypothetical protein